jgi:hypothetical protein
VLFGLIFRRLQLIRVKLIQLPVHRLAHGAYVGNARTLTDEHALEHLMHGQPGKIDTRPGHVVARCLVDGNTIVVSRPVRHVESPHDPGKVDRQVFLTVACKERSVQTYAEQYGASIAARCADGP